MNCPSCKRQMLERANGWHCECGTHVPRVTGQPPPPMLDPQQYESPDLGVEPPPKKTPPPPDEKPLPHPPTQQIQPSDEYLPPLPSDGSHMLTPETMISLTPPEDLTPEHPEIVRRNPLYCGGSAPLPDRILALTQLFARRVCKIRNNCNMMGDVAACCACLFEHIIVPDVVHKAGNKVVTWEPSP